MNKVEFSEKEFLAAYEGVRDNSLTFGNTRKLPDRDYCDLLVAGAAKAGDRFPAFPDFYEKMLRGE
jgi:hypothetical protein